MQINQSQLLCGADISLGRIVGSGYIPPSYISFGNVKIDCKTGEVTGLSENISDDAKFFWEQLKEHVIGK